MPNARRRKAKLAWWETVREEYPLHAKAPIAIKPQYVTGDHVSVGLRIGWRTWGFRSKSERDAFCVQYHAPPLN